MLSQLYTFKSSASMTIRMLVLSLGLTSQAVYAESLNELSDASFDDLLSQEVTSVSRKQQNLYTAPAAVYVITEDDMRRRGVRNVPEALAMAPGISVAAVDGNKWAISSRGFSSVYSNKLLVQIDGRSIYTPAFSGVYWDQHILPIQDIERIEVIRGSGATLWGANAVNGIINIITKQASDSQGGKLRASVSDQDSGTASLSYGGSFDEGSDYRVNVQTTEKGSNSRYDGLGDAEDDFQSKNISFRIDHALANDDFSITGGYQDAKEQQTLSVLNQPPPSFFTTDYVDEFDLSSWYLNSNWIRFHESGAESRLQFYIDNYERGEVYLGQDVVTYDLDYQLSLAPVGNHSVITGLGYRKINADFTNSYAVSVTPAENNLDLYNFFIQDEISLVPEQLSLTLGSKFEHNDFTGWEIQPNLRIAYTPVSGHFAWGAISKAVRTPSIAENGSTIQGGVTVPITSWVQGTDQQISEDITTYELGYRYFGSNVYTLDAAIFYSKYSDYISYEPISLNTFQMNNKLSGRSYGVELSSVWQATSKWQLATSYSFLDVDMEADSDSLDPLSLTVLNNSYAQHMFKLHSAYDLSSEWAFDIWFYYSDEVPIPSNYALFQGISVEDVISTNMRLGWRPTPDIEVDLTGYNLFDSPNLQSVGESFSKPTEIGQSVSLTLHWSF